MKGFLQSTQKQQLLLIIKHIATDFSIQKPTINKHPEIIFKKTKIYISVKIVLHGNVGAGGHAPEPGSRLTEFPYPNLSNSNSDYCQQKRNLKN